MTDQELAAIKAEEEERKRKANIARSQARTINMGQATPLGSPGMMQKGMMGQMGDQLKQQFMQKIVGTLFGFNKGGKVCCPDCGMINCNSGCKVGYNNGGKIRMPLAQQKQMNDERRKEEMHKLALRHKEEQHRLAMNTKARPPLAKGDQQ